MAVELNSISIHGIRDVVILTDSNGSPQPGNNYRAAASLTPADLNLQVERYNRPRYVFASDASVNGFGGAASPMLTVWRKLHIEVDSMEEVATSGNEKNFEEGTIYSYTPNAPATNFSIVELNMYLSGPANAYENGRIEIADVSTNKVISNTDNLVFGDDVVIEGIPGTNVIGKAFKIYDDDDNYLSLLGFPPALPRDDWSTNILHEVRDVFFPSYIDITNANAMGLNPNKRIPFLCSEEIGHLGGPFNDVKDLSGNNYFWAHTITFGYQSKESEDLDPNSEAPTFGITPKRSYLYPLFAGGISVIYIEICRDAELGIVANHIGNTNAYAMDRHYFINRVAGTIAHELGHAPGGQAAGDNQTAGTDHHEGGIMNEEGSSTAYRYW